jgi:predicted transcriptional regulator
MTQKGTTKDERFLLKLHEMALKRGGAEEEVDRFAVGRAIGLNDRVIDNIVRHLAQANFVKKGEEGAVMLTPHGLSLIEHLLA